MDGASCNGNCGLSGLQSVAACERRPQRYARHCEGPHAQEGHAVTGSLVKQLSNLGSALPSRVIRVKRPHRELQVKAGQPPAQQQQAEFVTVVPLQLAL